MASTYKTLTYKKFWSYFDYVMLTYKRYQTLRAIHIRVPGEPGNEASTPCIGVNSAGNLNIVDHWA